jgi:hypothetical protein
VADNFIMEYKPDTDIYITGTVGRKVNEPNYWWPWVTTPKNYDLNISDAKLVKGFTQTIDSFQIECA